MLKLKKRILAVVLSCLAILNLFSVPVMAAEPISSNTEELMVASIPPGSILAGRINRSGGSVLIPANVTLVGDNRLYIYLPKENNRDLFQGTITFRSGINVVTRQLSNFSTDTWVYTADNIGAGTWTVTVSGNAVGSSQKCDVCYKIE